MIHFHSYVSLPDGINYDVEWVILYSDLLNVILCFLIRKSTIYL